MILPLCCLLWHLATPAWAQETLSLKECREMALKYNKEMAASIMGGLLFGTLITLLFIPILYALFFHIKKTDK